MVESWSELTKHRDELYIWNVPIRKRNSTNPRELLAEFIKPSDRILDIGCGPAYDEYKKAFPEAKYFGMDIDKKVKADFHSLKEIKGKYDVVLMMNLVEHLTLTKFKKLLTVIKKHLKKNGKLIIWTHNVYAIPNIQFYDMTHVQHYPLGDLYGFIQPFGFELIKAYRVLDNRGIRKIRNIFKKPLCLILGVDWAWGLMLVVRKK